MSQRNSKRAREKRRRARRAMREINENKAHVAQMKRDNPRTTEQVWTYLFDIARRFDEWREEIESSDEEPDEDDFRARWYELMRWSLEDHPDNVCYYYATKMHYQIFVNKIGVEQLQELRDRIKANPDLFG